MEKRFFVAKSGIYGVTVYDRERHCPAFGYGASCDMEDCEAAMLKARLNIALRQGRLDSMTPRTA